MEGEDTGQVWQLSAVSIGRTVMGIGRQDGAGGIAMEEVYLCAVVHAISKTVACTALDRRFWLRHRTWN